MDFNPDGGATNDLTSNGDKDIFVAKYNSSGAYQWAFNIGGSKDGAGYGIALDASSNVYVTGNFEVMLMWTLTQVERLMTSLLMEVMTST